MHDGRRAALFSLPSLAQVVVLYAIQNGFCDRVPPNETAAYLDKAIAHVHSTAAAALREVAATKQLTAAAERGIQAALAQFASSMAGSSVSTQA